ncbi:MAG: S-layer homology domain-containing protein [Clostridiales bacterium]|nr:S-layer homology domain-containing protein [Clostridiales bacterium]
MTKKQLFAAVLASLTIASGATAVSAKTYDDVKEGSRAATEISILSDIGVIRGTSENEFSPDDPVTREQMATLLFRLMLGRDDAGRENTTAFADLYDPYYNGAISWANAAGYIRGTSPKSFNPKGGITKQDAMTMLVRALGQESAGMNAGYPWSYINQAVRLGLDQNLEDVAYAETLTRGETAQILYNALTAELRIPKTAQNGAVIEEVSSLIEEVFGYEMTDAILTATNRWAIDGAPVVKNGFVAFLTSDGRSMTVDGRRIAADADEHLGETFRLIVKTEGSVRTILSANPMSEREDFITASIDKKIVKIGDGRYTLVKEYSDALATNDSELKLFVYDDDAVLGQITSVDELKPLLGFCRISLIRADGEDTAKIGILTPYKVGRLDIDADGHVNLADGRRDVDVKNEANAVNGEYVLYYYNKNTSSLVIADTLDIVSGSVKRLTNGTAKIDDVLYDLGNETAGISADDIRAKLTLGKNATVAVYDGQIAAVIEGSVTVTTSKYLTALSDAYRVYEDGAFRYVMTAFLDGREQNIYVTDGAAQKGEVYRYLESDGEFRLIAAEAKDGVLERGAKKFAQNANGADEIALIIEAAKDSSVEADGRNSFILKAGGAETLATAAGMDAVKFIVDENAEIVVCQNGSWSRKRGANLGDMAIADGAKIVAVFQNEVGNVELLSYLCVSDGSVGAYDPDAASVRILAEVGQVYENGRSWTEYTVYNFAKGEIEAVLSSSGDLEKGHDYRLDAEGHVTGAEDAVTAEGVVTGYTSGTVSVDGTAYAIAKDMRAIRLTKDNKLEEVRYADLYLKHVEFIAQNGEVKLLIEGADPAFTAEMKDGVIEVTPDFDLDDLGGADVVVKGLEADGEAVSIDGMAAEAKDGVIAITLPAEMKLEAGRYTVSFTLNSKNGSAEFTVEAEAEAPAEDPGENAADPDAEGNG